MESINRSWHAKFDGGQQVIIDYWADEDSIEVWYLPKAQNWFEPYAEQNWEKAQSIRIYGVATNLSSVRTWAPEFKGGYFMQLEWHPIDKTMTVRLATENSKGWTHTTTAENREYLQEDLETNDIPLALRLAAHPFTGVDMPEGIRTMVLSAANEIERLQKENSVLRHA